MFAHISERERQILDILTEDSSLSIQQIGERIGVSHMTVRSDLTSLETKGIILRSRGGAIPAFHPEIIENQKEHPAIKNRIARAAAELVSDGDTIMVSDGTTTSLIPKYLLGKRDIRIVTNSTLVLPYVRANPALDIKIIGGDFKASAEAIVGSQALEQLQSFYVKYVFIGSGGFSVETGLTTTLMEGADIAKKMAGLGEKVVLTADSQKYGKKGFVNFLPLDRIDVLITDDGLSEVARSAIGELGIELILV